MCACVREREIENEGIYQQKQLALLALLTIATFPSFVHGSPTLNAAPCTDIWPVTALDAAQHNIEESSKGQNKQL